MSCRSCLRCRLTSVTPMSSSPWTTTAVWTWTASLLRSRPSMRRSPTTAVLKLSPSTRSSIRSYRHWLGSTGINCITQRQRFLRLTGKSAEFRLRSIASKVRGLPRRLPSRMLSSIVSWPSRMLRPRWLSWKPL